MTLNACIEVPGQATPAPMKGTYWQIRMKQAGLTQRRLAQTIDRPENTVSRQMKEEYEPVPGDLIAIILAWEMLSEDQRADWFDSIAREIKRR